MSADLRQRILADHDELRKRLAEIESLAAQFESGSADAAAELRERGLALYARFATHMTLEDEELMPAVRGAFSDGEKRALRLAHEHEEQRELLSYLNGRLADQLHPTTLVARELLAFAQYLRQDMAYEEESLLAGLASKA